MTKIMMSLVFALSLSTAFAQESDLSLPGEKWVAKFKGYVCAAFGPAVAAPTSFEALKVNFEQITTDSTLDNGLVKATFEQNGSSCRYSALVLADNTAATMRLVESKAYATTGESDCAEGKALLDTALESNNYLYYGHPHNLSVMAPVAGAEAVCGAGAQSVGITFVVSGRISK